MYDLVVKLKQFVIFNLRVKDFADLCDCIKDLNDS